MAIFPPRFLVLAAAALALTACGSRQAPVETRSPQDIIDAERQEGARPRSSIWDVFRRNSDEQVTQVNRYIWQASTDVLNFLPVDSVDPFTGVIVTGFGTPPGGGRAYRATIYVSDPALDARSLRVALQTRDGRPVATGTQRAVEDAILSRARQLRQRDAGF